MISRMLASGFPIAAGIWILDMHPASGFPIDIALMAGAVCGSYADWITCLYKSGMAEPDVPY